MYLYFLLRRISSNSRRLQCCAQCHNVHISLWCRNIYLRKCYFMEKYRWYHVNGRDATIKAAERETSFTDVVVLFLDINTFINIVKLNEQYFKMSTHTRWRFIFCIYTNVKFTYAIQITHTWNSLGVTSQYKLHSEYML